MNRREFLRLAAGTSAAGVLGKALASPDSKSSRPPNVVLIISDDQHWADYGFMGSKIVRTPHIDRLAGAGLVLRRAYVPTALCRPSLAVLSTGLYPHQHRITGNDADRRIPNGREESIKLHDAQPSLAKMLAKAGYNCLQTGKWWEGSWKRGGFTHGMTRGSRHGDAGLVIGRKTMKPIHDVIDESVKADKPFYIWYAPFLPHTPHNPPKRLLDKYLVEGRNKGLAAYYAMCEWLDETCGDLLGYLDTKGVADNTLVIFVTDNGWTQGGEDHGPFGKGRGKRTVYEGGVRSPIIVRWPGRVRPAVNDQHLASSIDIAPTILTACGLKPTSAMPGINLLDADALTGRQRIFGEGFTHDMMDLEAPAKSLVARWCIEGRWKLIVWAGQDKPAELYDVVADPREKKNLAGEHPDKVKALRAHIDQWWAAK